MTQKLGYLVDLSTVKFDDGDSTDTWIQAMPLGKYTHPLYGKIDITPDRVTRFAENVKKNVRGQQLDIDYDHKQYGGEAAGWVKDAEARPDGLWVLVEWTKKAYSLIKDKAYRYFSPEFNDVWEHPKTQQKYNDVLFGGGITNRPFLKDILPINMSEAFDRAQNEGGNTMDPEKLKALAKKYGLGEDATEDQVIQAAMDAELKPESSDGGEGDDKEGANKGDLVGAGAPQLSEELKKLSESSPAVKQLMDALDAQGRVLAENSRKLKESDVDKRVAKLSESAAKKGFALAPTAKSAITKALMETEGDTSDAIAQAFEKFVDAGLVQLTEIGQTTHTGESDAVKKFSDAVAEYQKNNQGVSYSDAVVQVSMDQPKLFAEYREASYSFSE